VSQSYKLQVSPYLADGSMLNIQGDTTEEFAHNLKWVSENATQIASAVSLIKGVGAIAEVLPVAETRTLAEAETWARPAQENPVYNAPAVQQYQQVAAQSAPQYQQQQSVGPICKHGPMQHKAGQGAKGPWQAFMCSAPRNAPDKCDPNWLRKGEAGWV
jgi:hypothetical protein